MSVQGNVKAVRSLTEPLQVAMDSGAKRAFIPIENKRQFLDVNPDVLEQVDPIFFGDLRQAAFSGSSCPLLGFPPIDRLGVVGYHLYRFQCLAGMSSPPVGKRWGPPRGP
jgi:hypothetical protein